MKDRIKKARMTSGMSQTELAEKIGIILNKNVQPQTVQKWESGNSAPRKENLNALSEALGVTPQWLQFGEGAGDQTVQMTSDEIELILLFREASLENKLAAVQALKGMVSVPQTQIKTQINSEKIGKINKIK